VAGEAGRIRDFALTLGPHAQPLFPRKRGAAQR
jgi:hypothetical protein